MRNQIFIFTHSTMPMVLTITIAIIRGAATFGVLLLGPVITRRATFTYCRAFAFAHCTFSLTMAPTTAITLDLLHSVDAHAAGKQCYRKKKTNDEDGNGHEYPAHRLEATKTQTLEHACAYDAYQEPPYHSVKVTDD
jgi:hypothetical protein